MNIVISEKETGKAFSKKVDDVEAFLNKKIGDNVSLGLIGMEGYEAKITGGSDLQGFPMHPAVSGSARRKIYSFNGIGFRQKTKGERRRKNVRGNTVSKETAQLNLIITKKGQRPFEEFSGKTEKKEEKLSAKEELVKKSLENVGNVELAEEAKKIKGKAKG